jgi:hypothetical protein
MRIDDAVADLELDVLGLDNLLGVEVLQQLLLGFGNGYSSLVAADCRPLWLYVCR